MTKVQFVSSKNSAWDFFCSKKGYKNKNMIWNKILIKNPVFMMFYQKLLATILYITKKIAKVQPSLRGQVAANQSTTTL